jgi:hypothetical protein
MFGERKLRPLAFHEALVAALQDLEPGLWRWFSSGGYGKKYADTVRVELCARPIAYWHYRGRDESLIAFSNRVFYEGKLQPCQSAS